MSGKELIFFVSYPENKLIGPTLLPGNDDAKTLHELMGKYVTSSQLRLLGDLGFTIKFDGDIQRYESGLKKQKIKLNRNHETGQVTFD